MSIIKSFSVGNGDMFYIKHNSSNFTIIDCCLDETNRENIVNEIIYESKNKSINRFISTHPDEDHIHGLEYLDSKNKILNFYCVENSAIKHDESRSFHYYCKLRDGYGHYYVEKGCSRKWMNSCDPHNPDDYGSACINFIWPIIDNVDYIEALNRVEKGEGFNNISPIFTYSLPRCVKAMWMGDIETEFLEKVKEKIDWPKVDILFAPHHGRDSGRVPSDVLKKLNPYIIVVGEAPSKDLNYYPGYNTITQNSAGDITFDCNASGVDVYIENESYRYNTDFLIKDSSHAKTLGNYLGSFSSNSF